MNNYNREMIKSLTEEIFNSKFRNIEDIFLYVIETMMKAERTEYLEYGHGERNESENKRNGFRKVKGNIPQLKGYKINIPRDRLGEFKPMILEIVRKETQEKNNLIIELYRKGLTTRDVGEVIKNIYGDKISAATVSNITKEWQKEIENWKKRELCEEYIAIYIDATFIPVRRETVAKEAFYTVLGLRTNLTREILGVYNIPQENIEGWKEIFEDLRSRGVKNTLLFVADGLRSLEDKIKSVFPFSDLQKCQLHKMRNISKKVRNLDKKEILQDYKNNVLRMEEKNYTFESALKNLDAFLKRWRKKYPRLKNLFPSGEREYYFTYLKYPFETRRMIYTTNWIENCNNQIKRTTKIRRSFPDPDSAMRLVCLKLMDFEENNLLKYKVTAFSSSLEKLESMLKKLN